MTDRASFTLGAEAMRARIIAGIRRWWGNARRSAGHRWPGHPHWLEGAVAGVKVEELLGSVSTGLAGGADGGLVSVDALRGEAGHDREHGASVDADTLPLPDAQQSPRAEAARIDAPLGEAFRIEKRFQQVI